MFQDQIKIYEILKSRSSYFCLILIFNAESVELRLIEMLSFFPPSKSIKHKSSGKYKAK